MRDSYAVITGASSGIGEAFARRLANEGYRLILAARRRERLEELACELKKQGTRCSLFTVDLSRKEECFRLAAALEGKRIGIFINNAGFGECGPFTETGLDRELEMIDVNVRALHILTKLVLKKMQKQGGGYLLNVASSAGLLPAGPYMAAYYATKAYVASLTRAAAQELKEQGSRVYIGALCPGPVDTEFNRVANVSFSLPGITPEACVDCAVRGMKRRRTLIVPTAAIKSAAVLGRMVPQSLCIKIAGMQQKKKLADREGGLD